MRLITRSSLSAALLLLSACGGGSAPAPAPTVSIAASATTIEAGDSTTLTWTSAYATTCSASGGWSGTLAASGTQTTGALSDDTSYSLICTGPGGTSRTSTVAITVNAPPTAQLSATPPAVATGGASTLTWSSSHATACTGSGDWSGNIAVSGTQSTGALTANATFGLTCTGPGGTSPPAMASITVYPLPTVSLSATPTAVAAGANATLTWTSNNADACTASGGWSGTLTASGTENTSPISASELYSIVCSGRGGVSVPATATVALIPAPTVTLSAAPNAVASGNVSVLTWTSANATSCTASGGWSGTKTPSGSLSTGPLTSSMTYVLICTGPGGSTAPVSASVTLLPLPTVTLTALPTAVASGNSAVLTWISANATACTASGGWSGSMMASGSESSGTLNSPTSFSLLCTGAGGNSAPVTVTVNIIPTATLTIMPSVITPGGSSTLSWSSSNATSCSGAPGLSGPLPGSGTQSTGIISASTAYSLTCNGAGGSSSAATATLTVSSTPMSLSPQTAAITLTRSQQFTATVPGGGTATWTVDGIANGNTQVGSISPSGLYVAGIAGIHTIVATSVANTTQSASSIVAVTDLPGVFTYHNDLARDGANTQEYALNTGNVNSTGFGKLASCPVDGAIYGQPLWAANVIVGGTSHNVVFVTTQHDSLFAFDADSTSCAQLWTISLIDLAHGGSAGETSVPNTLVGAGYGDIQPEIGVTGTPVIDSASGTLYVVSKSVNAAQTTFVQRLHAIDITSGNEKSGSPAVIAATYPGTGDGSSTVTFNTKQQNQRGGLAFANGTVYIIWSSHEDSSPWYGWIMSYQYTGTTFTQMAVFNSTPNVQRGGIWMGGGAPSIDSNNNLYVATGNGTFDGDSSSAPNNDYGDSLLQLNPSLQLTQYFTPSDELADAQGDADFASGGAALLANLPGPTVTHALICGGKDGTLYVLNRDLLGGFGDAVAVQKIALGHGIFSTSAFWNKNLFIAGIGGPLVAYQLNQSTVQFSLASSSSATYGFPGSTPSVSSSSTQNGIVWALNTNAYCTHQSSSCGPAVLHAYDATDLATELWNSASNAANSAGNAVKFSVPTVANGRVYIGTRGNNIGGADSSTSTPGELDIYGLTQ